MISGVLIPVTLTSMMIIVGTGLKRESFVPLLGAPLLLSAGSVLQVVLLPVIALVLIFLIDPAPEMAAGLLLVAACPGGALSNFYCHFARLNVALSVVLTAISSVLSFVVLPLVLAVSLPLIAIDGTVDVPVKALSLQLFLFLFIPIGAGMLLRHYFPLFVERYSWALSSFGMVLLVLLVVVIFAMQWDTAKHLSAQAAVLAVTFTCLAALAGWISALALGRGLRDRLVFAIEFSVRNLGAAILVAVSSLAQPEFAAFSALFAIYQFPLIVGLLIVYRKSKVH